MGQARLARVSFLNLRIFRLRTGAAVALVLAVICRCAAAQPEQVDLADASSEVGPPDVHLAVIRLQYELTALRYVSGVPTTDNTAALEVIAAAPRHVFYQAQVLFRKTNQLGEEIADRRQLPLDEVDAQWRRASPRPAPEGRDIVPADVLQLVTDASDRVRAILRLLNVNVSVVDQPGRDASRQSEDVLAELLKINSQINRMMHREFRMRDVYEQVLLAINYAGDLGGGYPGRGGPSDNKQPLDVYLRLVACVDLLRDVGVAMDVPTLDLQVNGGNAAAEVMPADVYDLMTMLISDLAYMVQYSGAEHTSPPRGEYRRPRYVLPSDVFELLGVLDAQLSALAPGAPADQTDDS